MFSFLLGTESSVSYGYDYNPEKSCPTAGRGRVCKVGGALPEMVLHTTAEYQDFATYLKDKLEDIGIALRIETVDPRVLRECV